MLALVLGATAGLLYATRGVWLAAITDALHSGGRRRRYGRQGDEAAADDVRLIRIEDSARVHGADAAQGKREDEEDVWDAVETDSTWGTGSTGAALPHGLANGGAGGSKNVAGSGGQIELEQMNGGAANAQRPLRQGKTL
jgi:hypothetical protein